MTENITSVLKVLPNNNIAKELNILKWNTDSTEGFLSEKLDRIYIFIY